MESKKIFGNINTQIYLSIAFLLFFVSSVFAAEHIYYDIDFSAPEHTAGQPPVVGTSTSTISQIRFGQPLVCDSFGHLQNQPLIFNTTGNPGDLYYDQIQLYLDSGTGFYYVSFDLEIQNLKGTTNHFVVLFDTPNVQNITFQSNGNCNIFGKAYFPYEENELMHFEIFMSIAEKRTTVYVNGVRRYNGVFNPTSTLDSMRFSLGLESGNTAPNHYTNVALDNIYITNESFLACEPISNAGGDKFVFAGANGLAQAQLDGSASYDPRGAVLDYHWSWSIDGADFGIDGVNPIIELPPGEHIINLVVNNGLCDSQSDEVKITVYDSSFKRHNVYIGRGNTPEYYLSSLVNHYRSQPDVNLTYAENMMPDDITKYDLYITANLYSNVYSSAEIAAIKNYINSGGRVLFFTDYHGTSSPGWQADPYLNGTLLPQLGSGMRINNKTLDGGGHHSSIPEQVIATPFTAGVEVFLYAATNSIGGGKPMLLASNLTDCIFAYENLGRGYLFISGDTNLMDAASNTENIYDNGRLFYNLVTASADIGIIPQDVNFLSKGLYSGLQTKYLTIQNYGSGVMNWQITGTIANWLRVAPTRGQAGDVNSIVTIIVDPAKAGYGKHSCQLEVIDRDGQTNPHPFSVHFEVLGPNTVINPSSLDLYVEKNTQLEKTFKITNTGYDTLDWRIDIPADCEWLIIELISGQCEPNESAEVRMIIDANYMNDGVYSLNIPISSPQAVSKNLYLNLTVYTPKDIYVPQDYNTIQKAVNAAGIGDTIIVGPGEYAGFNLTDKILLTVRSVEPENPEVVAATIIESSITVYGANPTINGLSVVNSLPAFNPEPYWPPTTSYGIIIDSSEAIIKNCQVYNCSSGGIYANNRISRGKGNIKLQNCIVSNNGNINSIKPLTSGAGIIINTKATIDKCLITGNCGEGINVGPECNEIIISSCTIADNCVRPSLKSKPYPGTAARRGIILNASIYNGKMTLVNSILSNAIEPNDVEILIRKRYTDILRPPYSYLPLNLEIKYCNIKGGVSKIYPVSDVNLTWGPPGNIDRDPCFVERGYVDSNGTTDYRDDFWVEGDYHLRSAGWRWSSERNYWTWDDETSRCIDSGSPAWDVGDEPLTLDDDPDNLFGENLRIDMGYYGGTEEASMPPYDFALLSDVDNSGIVNFEDYAYLTDFYFSQGDKLDCDLNRDGAVDLNDVMFLAADWLKKTYWSAGL